MWKQTEKPKTMLANKAIVREFAEMEPAPYDRPLSERRLQVYRRILNNGEFRTVVWAPAVCAETGNTYRVNGKHTATMLAELIDDLPEFHITVERYQCDFLTDVANLYNTFDSGLASRTVSDINASFAATIPELKAIGHRTVNLIVSAAAFIKWDDKERSKVPPAERAEELIDNVDFAQWLVGILPAGGGIQNSGNLAKYMYRSPVVSAMLATYRKAPRLAEQFWLEVRDEINADRDNASRVLARFLRSATLASGAGRDRSKKPVTNREVYAKCVHGWNAWRKDETTRLQYYPDAELPTPVK